MASVFRGLHTGQAACKSHRTRRRTWSSYSRQPNVVDGMFSYSRQRQTRHTVVLVSWNDPQDGYKQKSNTWKMRQALPVTAWCRPKCWRSGAHRAVRRTDSGAPSSTPNFKKWKSSASRRGWIRFMCSLEASFRFKIPTRAGKRFGGRILGCTGQRFDLDFAGDEDARPSHYVHSCIKRVILR